MLESLVIIDGSFGEGGGQILRTSMSLAAITGKELHIKNIRANREKPGLQPQHLMACLAVKEICQGRLDSAEVGSKENHFIPGKIKGKGPQFLSLKQFFLLCCLLNCRAK